MLRRMIAAVMLIAATLGAGCAQDHARSVEEENMAAVRAAHAALADGDLGRFKSAIGPNYVRHCQAMPPGLQELHGTDEFFAFIEEFILGVSEYTDEISQMIAQGDRVAYVSTMTGIQTGPMGGFPASNREFKLVNIVIHRLDNGKIVETWVSWDNVSFLSQLGFLPPPSADEGG